MPGGLRTLPWPGQELLQGALTGEWKRKNCISMVLRGPAAGSQQLERVLSLWLSTCRLQRGERNVDSLTVVGSGDRYELSGGQFGNVHESPRDVCTLRSCNSVSENFSEGNRHIGGATSFFGFSVFVISVQEIDIRVKLQGFLFLFLIFPVQKSAAHCSEKLETNAQQ